MARQHVLAEYEDLELAAVLARTYFVAKMAKDKSNGKLVSYSTFLTGSYYS